jgi:hypothetical protein
LLRALNPRVRASSHPPAEGRGPKDASPAKPSRTNGFRPNFQGDWRTGRAWERARLTLPRRAEVLYAIHGVGSGTGSSIPPGVNC